MLNNVVKRITIEGKSVIDGVITEGYTASIDSSNPTDISFSSYQADKESYKKNRTQCRKDRAEFEDKAYTIQDQLIAEQGTSEE